MAEVMKFMSVSMVHTCCYAVMCDEWYLHREWISSDSIYELIIKGCNLLKCGSE